MPRGRPAWLAIVACALMAAGAPLRPTSVDAAQTAAVPRFTDVTEASGVAFRHHHGGVGDKQLPETMGAGVGWIDYDRDGRWDLYFVDSGPLPAETGAGVPGLWPGTGERPPGANALYRAGPAEGFELARSAGLADLGYGLGTSVVDYDSDGWPDIHVANFGRNSLYRNNGDGTFSDVTASAGIGDPRWSVSAAWGDLDVDGLPDLYVVNYLLYDLANPLFCGEPEEGIRSYCHITLFDGIADALFRNRGDGSFAEVPSGADLEEKESKGLGVTMGRIDDDALLDIYVANDTTRNLLLLNRGDLVFDDVGLIAGVGYGADGRPQAGMGTELGDVDGDGALEILVTNFAFEPVNLFRAASPGFFLDDTFQLGVGAATVTTLGFGLVLEDLDGDGDLDLVVANGHILDNVSDIKDNTSYAQPNQLLMNQLVELRSRQPEGWRPTRDLFIDATEAAGEALSRARVSRGLASGDLNDDGKPDLAITTSNGAAELLRNDDGSGSNRLVLRLAGRASSRDAVGARLSVRPTNSDTSWVRDVRSASSYASQHARDVYIGLADGESARVEVDWPSGHREVVEELAAGNLFLLVEGRGAVARQPLRSGDGGAAPRDGR